MGDEKGLRPAVKTPLRLQLQETVPFRFWQFRQLGLQGQQPSQGQADGATAFAQAGLVQMIADFPPDQFRVVGQRRKRQVGGDGLPDAQRAVAAAENDGLQPVAVQGQSED